MSSGSLGPLMPLELRRKLLNFKLLHGSSHPGIPASWRLLSAQYLWPGLSRDLGLWARSCFRRPQSKIHTHVHASVPAISVPYRQFSHVHLDLVGPLPSSHGFMYLLTIIDRTTRWLLCNNHYRVC